MLNYLVEFLGTVILMFVILTIGNPIAIGCALAIVIILSKNISYGSFNPAVSIALYAAGKLPEAQLIPYIIVEILGALVAFYMYTNFIK